jgi:hypothetical protein
MVEVVSDKGMDQKSVVDTISDACGCKVDLKDVKCIRSEDVRNDHVFVDR